MTTAAIAGTAAEIYRLLATWSSTCCAGSRGWGRYYSYSYWDPKTFIVVAKTGLLGSGGC